jgi:hypothetical protein
MNRARIQLIESKNIKIIIKMISLSQQVLTIETNIYNRNIYIHLLVKLKNLWLIDYIQEIKVKFLLYQVE